MSRKRANDVAHPEPSDCTPRKRLHATLASDFESLRLSPLGRMPESSAPVSEPQSSFTLPQAPIYESYGALNAFGTPPFRNSPFLPATSSPPVTTTTNTPFPKADNSLDARSQQHARVSPLGDSFGPDFRNTLPTFSHAPTSVVVSDVSHEPCFKTGMPLMNQTQPDVSSPASSASAMVVDHSSTAQWHGSVSPMTQYGDVVVEEVDEEELTDADAKWSDSAGSSHASYSSDELANKGEDTDMQDEDNPSEENRLVLYRPPVRTSASNVATLNARLPSSHFAMRNRSDDWFVTRMADAHKRNLAVVPYVGQAPPSKRRRDAYSHPVIQMPWTDKPSASSVAASAAVGSACLPYDDSHMVTDFGSPNPNYANPEFIFNVPPAKRITLPRTPAMHQFPLGRHQHMEVSPSV